MSKSFFSLKHSAISPFNVGARYFKWSIGRCTARIATHPYTSYIITLTSLLIWYDSNICPLFWHRFICTLHRRYILPSVHLKAAFHCYSAIPLLTGYCRGKSVFANQSFIQSQTLQTSFLFHHGLKCATVSSSEDTQRFLQNASPM